MPKGKPCTICTHDKRHVMEIGLILRVPTPVMAKRFGVSSDALLRHRKKHIGPQVAAGIMAARAPQDIDLEQLSRDESEGLLASLVAQRARLQVMADAALDAGGPTQAASIERVILSNLEQTSKLLGLIVQHHEVRSTSVLISADYLKLRQVLVTALKPFPEAAAAVGAALHALETDAATELTARAAAGKPLIADMRMQEEADAD